MIYANKITIFYVFDESEDLRNTLQLVEVEDISSIQVFTELEWGRDAFKIIASPRSA